MGGAPAPGRSASVLALGRSGRRMRVRSLPPPAPLPGPMSGGRPARRGGRVPPHLAIQPPASDGYAGAGARASAWVEAVTGAGA